MSQFNVEVTKIENKKSKKGTWILIDVLKDDEKTQQENIFGDIADSIIKTGLGKYQFTYAKDGKYWNVTEIAFAGAGSSKSANGSGASRPAQASGGYDKTALVVAKATLAGQCAQAAATVSVAALSAGQGMTFETTDALSDFVIGLTKELRADAQAFVKGEAQGVPAEKVPFGGGDTEGA